MPESEFVFDAEDGARLLGRRWLPAGRAKAMVQIAHGLAEHSARYARLAGALNAAGYGAYAFDLRGHGPPARPAISAISPTRTAGRSASATYGPSTA